MVAAAVAAADVVAQAELIAAAVAHRAHECMLWAAPLAASTITLALPINVITMANATGEEVTQGRLAQDSDAAITPQTIHTTNEDLARIVCRDCTRLAAMGSA